LDILQHCRLGADCFLDSFVINRIQSELLRIMHIGIKPPKVEHEFLRPLEQILLRIHGTLLITLIPYPNTIMRCPAPLSHEYL
jgi:hypothetical protein